MCSKSRLFQNQSRMLLSSQSGTTMDQVLDKNQEKTVKSFYILRQYSKTLSVVVTTSWLSVMPTHQLESQFLQTNTIKLLKFLATQKLHLKFHGNFKLVCLTFLVLCTVCLFFGIILLRSLKPREHQLFPLNNPK